MAGYPTRLAPSGTVPEGTTELWKDRKRYLWLIGLVVPSLAFVAFGGYLATGWSVWFWIGPIVILGDRAGDRPGRRARPLQPAGRRDRGAGAGPLLPLDHLSLPAHPVRRLPRRDGRDRRLGLLRAARRPAVVDARQDRHGRLDRLHRRHRHQHRPRARPQEGGQRALAVEDRAGAGLLRPLLHRAQPRPPRPGRHARGPRERPAGRELLPVLAAHGRRVAEVRLAPGEAPAGAAQAEPVAPRQRRAQRLADVAGAVGGRHRGLRHRGRRPS